MPVLEANVAKIKELNPGWEYRFYEDADIEAYISMHFPWALAYLKRIKPHYGAAKADLFRYLLMYEEGGVYLDIKSSVSRPLDEVLHPNDSYLLSHWHNGPGEAFEGWGLWPEIDLPGGEFQQWHIVAMPGHPFLQRTIQRVCKNIENYDPRRDGVGLRGVLRLTGPIAYTLSIQPLLDSGDYRLGDVVDDFGFIYSIFDRNDEHRRQLDMQWYGNNTDSILYV
jgi:hypothetical protein